MEIGDDVVRGPDGWPIRIDLVEQMARLLYISFIKDCDYEMIFGERREDWLEVAEHSRDDYRYQAISAFAFLSELGLLKDQSWKEYPIYKRR